MSFFESAVFGNHGGSHQLLSSSLPATASVLEALRFLVDRPAGHVGSEITWFPYWGCQSLERWWVLWRGEEDRAAARKNMVTARVALIPADQCSTLDDLDELFAAVGHVASQSGVAQASHLAASVVDCLASGQGPAIVADLSLAPLLLRALWPRLWASARASLSLRTLFGVESLDSVSQSSIVVIPTELKPRWYSRRLLGQDDTRSGPAARWFAGTGSPHLARLITANTAQLPGDFSVLERVERIGERLERLHGGTGTLTDALVVVRTQEAFSGGLLLSRDDLRALAIALAKLDHGSVNEVRTASLAKLDALPDPGAAEAALTRWVEEHLPEQSAADALWILTQHAGAAHAAWWRGAVGNGVDAGCRAKSRLWATAIWLWWQARPDGVSLTLAHLEKTLATEEWLATNAPVNVDDALIDRLAVVCREHGWSTLFARALGSSRPLTACIEKLRANVSHPEAGLDALLLGRDAAEIVDAAAVTCWSPLVARAVRHTLAKPELLARALGFGGLVPLLLGHLSQGGAFPSELVREDFLVRIFDAVLTGDDGSLRIVERLDRRAGLFVLDHPQCEQLLSRVSGDVVQGAVEEWWGRFLTDDSVSRPSAGLCTPALTLARSRAGGKPITLVISLLRLFPEITEANFEEWMNDTGFLWQARDHQRLADLLAERHWSAAARTLRWSWKSELKLVAWHARDLLSWFDRFWSPPEGADQPTWKYSSTMLRKEMKVLFLAANPLSSSKLALDEEARAIEEKVRDARHRDLVVIRTRWAVRPEDLQQALLEDEPTVVHFSGHGAGAVGIVLHSAGQTDKRLVAADALTDLFRVLKGGIRVVVLNACYSEVQANAIVEQIDFVVGMSDSIRDDAARSFAAAFYRGLAFGRSVSTAFDLGLNELKLVGLSQDDAIPRLLVRPGVDANAILVRGASS